MKKLQALIFTILSVILAIGSFPALVKAAPDCSDPKSYVVNPQINITPSSPTSRQSFKVEANFSFKNEFANCLSKTGYYFKFYYDDYGGSFRSQPKQSKLSGLILSESDTQSWATITKNITPTSDQVAVTVGLFALSPEGVPYDDTAIAKSQTIKIQGVTINSDSGSGSGSGTGTDTGAGANANQAAPTSGSDSGSGSGASGASGSGSADIGKTFYNPLGSKTKDIPTFIISVIKTILGVTGALAVLFIIIGGLRYIISAGNETAAKEAKNTITYAIIGLIFAVMSFAIVTVITNLLINK